MPNSACMAADLQGAGTIQAWVNQLDSGWMRREARAPFTCPGRENRCEIQRLVPKIKTCPFGCPLVFRPRRQAFNDYAFDRRRFGKA